MPVDAAQTYHAEQVAVLADAGCDLVSAITMTNVPEAVGVARAAMECGVPSVISFTVETDGRLPSGDTLEHAITAVDALTASAPVYYMINCAHPTHFEHVLGDGAPWVRRIRGLRANASRQSHAELNESPTLDIGDPVELGQQYAALKRRLPQLCVLGGCCGTDDRHVEQIAAACAPLF
jgi:S-methylmethionine-dependent homocysteine/selenocysteine methylase